MSVAFYFNNPGFNPVNDPNKLSNNTSFDILLCVSPPSTIIPEEHEKTQCPVLSATSEESNILIHDDL